MNGQINRGEIYYANLNPIIGSEQGGIRPVLIIQNDIGNKYSPTIVIAAITSKEKTKTNMPTHFPIPQNVGLDKNSIVLLEQVRTIDKKRLMEHIGSLSDNEMKAVDRSLAISLGLDL